MMNTGRFGIILIVASLFVAPLPAPAAPLAELHGLVGTWKCTYRAGAVHLPYAATYAYDADGHILREVVSLAGGGGDEELLAYDAQHAAWSVVVFDGQGSAVVMHGTGSDPKHFAYRSVYPDASIAVRFDYLSATEYTLRGRVRAGGKTIDSVDTCVR